MSETIEQGAGGSVDGRSGAFEDTRQEQDGLPSTAEPRREIEIILARQLAGYLALPIVIADASMTVVYYNEPAERILGRRFDERGAIPWTAWSAAFQFTDEKGQPLPADRTPVPAAFRLRRLVHTALWMRGLDGVRHHVNGTGIPLIGNANRFVGVVGVFDEIPE